MRVAVITSLYKPHTRGGAEVIADRVVRGLAAAGHDVCVITTTPERGVSEPRTETIDGVTVHRFRPFNVFAFADIASQPLWKRAVFAVFDVFQFHSYRVIRDLLAHERPDLVLTHNLKGIGYTIPRAIRTSGIRHIHTVHDVQLAVPSGLLMLGREWVARLYAPYAACMRLLFGSPDVVVSPSAWLMQFYEYRGFFRNSEKRIIPNPVDPAQFTCEKALDTERVQYAFVGQLELHKGILFLLDAFNEFSMRTQNAHLVIAGTGSLYDTLRFRYADHPHVTVLGYVPGAELCTRIFRYAHYTIVASTCYENSPGIIYDSMASGTPVIAADIGGAAELVKHSETGYVIEPGNRYELLKALETSRAQAAHSPDLGERGRMYLKDFRIDSYLARLIA